MLIKTTQIVTSLCSASQPAARSPQHPQPATATMDFSKCLDRYTSNRNFITWEDIKIFHECVREHPPTSYRDIGALKKYLEWLEHLIDDLYRALEDEPYTPGESSDPYITDLVDELEARKCEKSEIKRIMKELEQSA